MLHLRVVCPTAGTPAVLRVLRDEPGATHLVHLPGASVVPAGDLVEADVAREAMEGILVRLCELGVDHSGGITVESVDTSLSDLAVAAEEAAPGEGTDAVVWEELVARTGDEAKLSFTFLAFLTIACLLASIGVLTNSPVTVVGAMVVGPEFGPLAAIAVGVVRRRWDLARRAALALWVGFPVAMVVTAGATLLAEWAGLVHRGDLGRLHQVDFIYQVGVFSLVVALLAGAAGMLSMTSAKSAALVGVFISVTTVPAAGFATVAAIVGDWPRCLGSVAQLAVNLAGIVIAAVLVLLVRRSGAARDAGRPLSRG
ncbi:MAG: DUF389 domain-containing protein [Sciscionella sp.]